MKKSLIKTTAAISFVMLSLNVHADQGSPGMKMDMGNMKMDSMGMESSKGMAMATNQAEVKAIDKANNRITLKHGPIKSKTVEMTPMTMSFPVQEAALISNVKVGDKVAFNVENIKGKATVTALQPQK